MRTSENSVKAKFEESIFYALGRSFFDGAAPTETQAHRSDSQCQRIRLATCCALQPLVARQCRGRGFGLSLLLTYC